MMVTFALPLSAKSPTPLQKNSSRRMYFAKSSEFVFSELGPRAAGLHSLPNWFNLVSDTFTCRVLLQISVRCSGGHNSCCARGPRTGSIRTQFSSFQED